MEHPKMEDILKAAAVTAETWNDDWKHYIGEVCRLTGLTMEQAFGFDMMLTWRDVRYAMGTMVSQTMVMWEKQNRIMDHAIKAIDDEKDILGG